MWGSTNVGGRAPSFWGDGSDGILSAGATYLAGTDFEKYSGFCIKQFSEIDWDPASPETLTVDAPCRGLILFSQGPVYIGQNATISMAKLGSILPVNPESLIEMYGDSVQMRHIVDVLKTLRGGAGGDGGAGHSDSGTNGPGGTGGPGRVCQGGRGAGGGSGAFNTDVDGKAGGSIIWPEGMGWGGQSRNGNIGVGNGADATDGVNGGGGGADGISNGFGCGGTPYGAGGGGGGAYNGKHGEDGEHTGGFILIIASGSVTIDGTLDVTGGNGGNGGGGRSNGGGGGGAGGGVIALFAQTSVDVSTAIINKNGGQGGTGYQNGTGGQQGTLYTEAI